MLLESIHGLQSKLVATARQYQTTVLPGYTHLQRAQPVTFSHWALAYAWKCWIVTIPACRMH